MPQKKNLRDLAKAAIKKSKPMHKMPDGRMMAGKSHPKSKKRNGIY
jgi:hypothetical protein